MTRGMGKTGEITFLLRAFESEIEISPNEPGLKCLKSVGAHHDQLYNNFSLSPFGDTAYQHFEFVA